MIIQDYYTNGGKNVIKEFLHDLPREEQLEGYRIRHNIIKYGIEVFKLINARQLKGKLWEIKFFDNRIMYVIAESVHFLHACKKQKGKAEKFELDKAIQRAKERDLL
ncbi:MAG: type II toxin-antitoxin system RelE/ParE family toxin [Lachnospiraceae bacterium]|nr:type II toxin-antitoxin system RelE/ParE family toxin [Lachnospiraceae bacterium]